MKKRMIPLLLALALLLGIPVILSVYAQEDVVLPSWCYDFSTADSLKDFSGGSNLIYEFTEGSHCTFTALANDPAMHLTSPMIDVSDAAYLCIEYRTSSPRMGEIYISRTDGVTFCEDPESNFEWQWDFDGEWHRLIVRCDGWADTEGVALTGLRFDPLHDHQGVQENDSIDIRFFAFFNDEQKAKDFDFAAYQKFVAENGTQLPEDVTLPNTFWDDPEYVEITPHPDDNYEGTLNISYSEDGKYATISYGKGENAVSYTVPNNDINLFGGYAGTDDLDRSLFDASQVGVVTEDHDVGIFYFLWHGEHGDTGVYDLQKIIDQVGVEAAATDACGLYGKVHEWHYWGEPLYGYYYIDDNWVMRKHVELLINAGVDFLYFDTTNNFTYSDNALKLMAILHDFNKMGFDAPEVVFYTNTDATVRVNQIYNEIYKNGYYKDTWYMIDGKPVIVAPYEANVDDFFTVKLNQWPTEDIKQNGWPWMDFEWPQSIYADENGNPSAINVSIAQHSGSVCFSDSAFHGDTSNLGRSFNEKKNNTIVRNTYYNKLKKDPELYKQGLNFQAQWDRAIEADVPFVLVTGWNEWIAQRQITDDNTVKFVDLASAEFSRDAEMMRGGYFDNYYMQLAYNIQRLKGAAPIIVQDARNAVNVTGSFDVWDKVAVTYTDPAKDMLNRNAYGFGGVKYTNETGRNDILAAKVTADTKNVYFYVETREDITKSEADTSWMQLFLSTGGDGWYGYDYIVNYEAKDDFTTTVARYDGTDNAYSYEVVGEVSYRAKENRMMIAVPLEMLGITNPNGIKFQFKWADSRTEITTMEQFYTDGDAAPLGRLNYTFQNCPDPEKAEQYVPGELTTKPTSTEPEAPEIDSTETSEPETESEQKETMHAETTEASTPSFAEPNTEQPEQKSGCKSSVGGVLLLIGLAVVPLVVSKKKK